ncbi:unnamed protein product [Acanthoscelides obtectus]|uniref:Uncharacterized protein n=1 Tax=Acanthoscelides obtectus TaxID=200917 RepID=A0A9P0VP36_ACAOB|nr:unnamed protein product [Acanthoscelides obtectus]CAK1649545.1 hypothetical protein AOBTE_LOCUS16302 [Acanthoscelides obtectus]
MKQKFKTFFIKIRHSIIINPTITCSAKAKLTTLTCQNPSCRLSSSL